MYSILLRQSSDELRAVTKTGSDPDFDEGVLVRFPVDPVSFKF